MLVTKCSVCGSEKCDGREWEIVPGDPEFASYSRLPGTTTAREDFRICSSLVCQKSKPPVADFDFELTVAHGVAFRFRVRPLNPV